MRAPGWVLAVAAVGLVLPACRPSYRTGTTRETIQQLCQREYRQPVEVVILGRTIAASVSAANLLKSDLVLSDQALQKVENVMLTVTRVALSSETRYDFFTIGVYDPKTRVRLTFVRYLKDIRRLLVDDISRSDFFKRMLIDVTVDPAGALPKDFAHEYKLLEFTARLIGDHIRQDLQQNLVVSRLFQVDSVLCESVRLPGLRGRGTAADQLRLAVFFNPQAPPFGTVGTQELRNAFLDSLFLTARSVARKYEATDVEGLEIVDGATGRSLVFYPRKRFSADSVNQLMDAIKNLGDQAK